MVDPFSEITPFDLLRIGVFLLIVVAAIYALWTQDDHRQCRNAVLVQCHVHPDGCVGYGKHICESEE